jgi:hypothetical protein
MVHHLTQDFEIMTKPKHIVERMNQNTDWIEINLKVWLFRTKTEWPFKSFK